MKFTRLFAAAAVAAVAMGSQSAMAASANIDASATVVTAIAVSAGEALRFGRIVKPTDATNNVVTIALADGSRTSTLGASTLQTGATTGNGTFTVAGLDTATYSVGVVGVAGSDANVALTAVTAKCSAGAVELTTGTALSKSGTCTLGATGDTITVGGDVTITKDATDSPSAVSAGTITATVNYN